MTTFYVTDLSSWPLEFKIFIGAGWIGLIILNLLLRTYIYAVHLSQMINCFRNSPYIVITSSKLSNQGMIARKQLIDNIFGAIRYAPKMIELGYISAHDVANLPTYLKVILYSQNLATRIAITWMIGTVTALIAIDIIKKW